jgi:transcriptional regulator with XRE-family HTH domain
MAGGVQGEAHPSLSAGNTPWGNIKVYYACRRIDALKSDCDISGFRHTNALQRIRKMTQSETAASLYELYENCDPGLLKRTRQAAGMDEGVLARRACLSTAQVRQLESGGTGLFYSITIKRQAYKRLMMILGADPPMHAPVSVAETASATSHAVQQDHHETIENIVALSSKSDYLVRQPVKDFFLDLRYRIVANRQSLGALLFLVVAVVVLVLNWRGALTFNSQANTAETKSEPPPTEVAKSVAPTPVAAPTSSPAASAATTTSSTASSLSSPTVVAASATNVPAVAAPAKPPVAAPKGCAHTEEKLPEVVSVSANKPPSYVFVTSPVQTTVCVVDGNKNATVLELRPNEGRSVYGSPPWQLSGNALKDAQIFFQGVRVKAPDGQEQQFKLMEKPSAP